MRWVWHPSGYPSGYPSGPLRGAGHFHLLYRRSPLRCDLRLFCANPHRFDFACDVGGSIRICPWAAKGVAIQLKTAREPPYDVLMSEPSDSTPVLPAKHVAVLVIDVQIGPFEAEPRPFEADEVVRRINAVTAKARAAKVPVIFIGHDGPEDPNWRVPSGWAFHPHLKIALRETVIHKTTADAFYGTDLEKTLRHGGIQSLLVMGYATDFCVDATLRNAASKDFEIFVVRDAHTTNDTPDLKASDVQRHFNWAWSESYSSRGIHLLSASQVHFAVPD
jgi:nicotinamidase-related amidase